MRLSICLPQAGAIAGPAAIIGTARLAEHLGFDGVWLFDRLLAPLVPAEPYPRPPTVRCPPRSNGSWIR